MHLRFSQSNQPPDLAYDSTELSINSKVVLLTITREELSVHSEDFSRESVERHCRAKKRFSPGKGVAEDGCHELRAVD